MTNLGKVEEIRRNLLKTIAEMTGVPIGKIQVDIGFHQQDENGNLFLEARKLDWLPNEYNGATWIASDERGGCTAVYKNEEEGNDDASTNQY